jgi:polysaccharide export outer membrane protein
LLPRLTLSGLVLLIVLAVGNWSSVTAQIPTRAQAERLLRENPELARQRLLESGLSQAGIRAQLTAAGIPVDQLDAFLSGEPIDGATAFDANTVSALELLGVVVQTADGLEIVDVETGMQFGSADDPASIEGFPIFGHDVFTRASSQFQPLTSGPVSGDYRVGPGDRMVLILTGELELAHGLAVTREGFVVVPEVGRISIANLTMAQARDPDSGSARTLLFGDWPRDNHGRPHDRRTADEPDLRDR